MARIGTLGTVLAEALRNERVHDVNDGSLLFGRFDLVETFGESKA
jgi:hypothetical protein